MYLAYYAFKFNLNNEYINISITQNSLAQRYQKQRTENWRLFAFLFSFCDRLKSKARAYVFFFLVLTFVNV